MAYADPTTGEFIGEFETRDAEGNVTRRTEWFSTQAEATRFSKTGSAVKRGTITRKPITGHSMQVALTIKKQIGVWPFAEVGARGFMYDENSLYFDAKPKSRIVRVVVTLDSSDTYSVRVVNKKTGLDIWTEDGIYNDSLATVIRNLSKHL